MKRILFFTAVVMLASCSTYTPMVNFIDYSGYTDQGMFLTESNSVSFDYQPVGSINVLLYSGFAKTNQQPASTETKKEKVLSDGVYYSGNSAQSKGNYQTATIQEALRIAVQEAKSKGANGIINLSFEYVPYTKGSPSGWYVSGMAIKM